MKNKKIGILSMHRIINYGSYMQALGLKRLLQSIGIQSEFIDYHIGNTLSKSNIRNTILYKFIRNALSFIKPVKIDEEKIAIESQWRELGLRKRYKYRKKVDILIVGSDEVFNYIQKGANVGYAPELIGYNNRAKKIISYAASCGNLTRSKLDNKNKFMEFAEAMRKFDALSVRDDNTYELVMSTGVNIVQRHLDPVLVSDIDSIGIDNVTIDNYILIYGYSNRFSEYEGKILTKYAREKGKKLISLGGKQTFCDNIVCKPMELLAYFRHAELIITDTFHGTIFSVITESNFATIVRYGEDGNENKLTCLLKQLGLSDRILSDIEKIDDVVSRTIDYESVRKIRKEEHNKTMEYLRSQLL